MVLTHPCFTPVPRRALPSPGRSSRAVAVITTHFTAAWSRRVMPLTPSPIFLGRDSRHCPVLGTADPGKTPGKREETARRNVIIRYPSVIIALF